MSERVQGSRFTVQESTPAWAVEELAQAEYAASMIILAADRPGEKPVSVAPAWGQPIAEFVRWAQSMADQARSGAEFIRAMDGARKALPSFLAAMDVDALADVIEQGLAENVVAGAVAARAKLGPKILPLAAGDMTQIVLGPLEAAIVKLNARKAVGARLTSAEWADVPLAIRERSFWSARVESARLVQAMQDTIGKRLAWATQKIAASPTAAGGEALFDRSVFIADMRALAIAEGINTTDPEYFGTVRDIRSAARLGLVWDMQNKQATEFARWKMDHDPDVLDGWPAQRLVRIEEREQPRDWAARWRAAGEEASWMGASRGAMVALKTSPIWTALSAFGTPWPPFDWGSGMGLEDVDRAEAEELGLLPADAPVPDFPSGSGPVGFNTQLQASVSDLSAPMLSWLQQSLGDRATLSEDVLLFR